MHRLRPSDYDSLGYAGSGYGRPDGLCQLYPQELRRKRRGTYHGNHQRKRGLGIGVNPAKTQEDYYVFTGGIVPAKLWIAIIAIHGLFCLFVLREDLFFSEGTIFTFINQRQDRFCRASAQRAGQTADYIGNIKTREITRRTLGFNFLY